eukprot:TRINITY_DN576_c0_g1_i1.p2 TRINITY_DN576_c0_g1~~TRINITY_DN576_c0_g1_i1.p2  ORF type:complete len:319 (-),score=127.47 TRINITY_DN576_c0_g1_i1:368-1324(-)
MAASVASNFLKGQDVLSVKQFSPEQIEYVMSVAEKMVGVASNGMSELCKGKILANLFYEPSTRTSSSFHTAMLRLGGQVLSITDVQNSSVSKGETLEDTVRCLQCYCDALVLRHPVVGSAALAAKYARIPVLNAGDGIGEHPTQALLDLFTIRRELGDVNGLTVTMLGDLKNGRTVHSLARLLALYRVKLVYVSTESLRMPSELVSELKECGVEQEETTDLESVLPRTDVLYVTRVQKERFASLDEYKQVVAAYTITPQAMQAAKQRMIVMHPLPRVNEIHPEVDDDPRAAYFRQMESGLYVRMALLALVLGAIPENF